MNDFPERDHGYGKPPEPAGVPVVGGEAEGLELLEAAELAVNALLNLCSASRENEQAPWNQGGYASKAYNSLRAAIANAKKDNLGGEAEGLPPCPNCGCVRLFMLTVELEEGPPQLRVPEGCVAVGTYVGCPACPFASPMVTTAVRKEKS